MSRSTAYVITGQGAAIFKYQEEFLKLHADDYPLSDYIHKKISREEYGQKMDIFRQAEREYVTRKLFNDFGYEAAYNYNANMVATWKPCLGGDGQCNMNCIAFGQKNCI